MAEIVNTTVIGAHIVRPTGYTESLVEGVPDGQLFTLQRYDNALGNVGHDRFHFAPASFFIWSLYVAATANNSTVDTMTVNAPWPFTIWAIDGGCESLAGGGAGTFDVFVAAASILNAAEAIVDTGAGDGAAVRVAPEVGSDAVAYNAAIFARFIETATQALVGGQVHLFCQRL